MALVGIAPVIPRDGAMGSTAGSEPAAGGSIPPPASKGVTFRSLGSGLIIYRDLPCGVFFGGYSMDTYDVASDVQVYEMTVIEAVQELNDSVVHGQAVISALFGLLIGFLCLRELLRIWHD